MQANELSRTPEFKDDPRKQLKLGSWSVGRGCVNASANSVAEFISCLLLVHQPLFTTSDSIQGEDLPAYDILLNPERAEELEEEMGSMRRRMEAAFTRMNVTDPEVNSLMLGALWFSVYPCREFIVGTVIGFSGRSICDPIL